MDEASVNRLAHFLLKKINRAVYEFDMIRDGDRIAVALSGGKDSFSLLKVLTYRRQFAPEKYEVAAIHVIGDARGPDMPPYPELAEWLEGQGIEHLTRPTFMAENEELPMSCERCTWNRRRTLFELASDLGCNKIAFGHHLDDLAETALLNLVYHGKNETMAPVREYFGGKTAIIRPMAYVPEAELKRFSSACEFPPPPDPCPRGGQTRRKRMKDLISELAKESPKLRSNLVRAALRGQNSSSML